MPGEAQVMRRWLAGFLLLVFGLIFADRVWPPDLTRYRDVCLVVEARDGTVVDVLAARDGDWRLKVGVDEVSPNFLRLLVSAEDKRFWWNAGVDPLAMARAVWQLATRGRVVSGGSTITMQVARLLAPHRHDLAGKVLDSLRALQLTAHYSKTQILDMYLTLAPYGGNIEGVRAAALIYFQKEPLHLTLAQAALLVALPRSPERLRPDRHVGASAVAAARILGRAGLGAAFSVAALDGVTRHGLPALAPHLAWRLRGEGFAGDVKTTLAAGVQEEVVELLAREVGFLGAQQAMAALVVDNRDRRVVAYLGGARFFGAGGMVDMVRARRSPGSVLKPFIYGMAMDDSLIVPDTMMDDAPADLAGYAPRDFDGGYAGMVTAREALQQSLNVPAVALLRAVGARRFVAGLRAAGVRLVLPGNGEASLPVALGGVGISMEDVAALYAGLADGGEVGPVGVLPGGEGRPVAVMSGMAAAEVGGILRGSPLPGGVAAPQRAVGFKTGTSYGFRDAWAAGFSPDYTVVVWVGRVDGTPNPGAYGRLTAAPLMFKIFALLPADEGSVAVAPEVEAAGLRVFGVAAAASGPRILFPPGGAILQVSGMAAPISLEAAGGTPPYRWVVNGTMLPKAPVGVSMSWLPGGAGFAHIAVIDKNERAASEDVQMR